ncbi:Di-trans-poly-cis-decaprenylcistransferase [Basidiobolus meristosporus CBS 931.73]|uniref:Alkyl transferase n=1 Tax=Basidiobolus meristosporus CBS 931.73 TaxID=1314790 RepID=A0A1Y1YH92_9FUNG|nr:Di-trans-poly-cis-decaprenylcistransferase [Basidiobolus meristosporus CBS 931.73]|eukprot:ORX97367.1 Di-trans-poly-cis-decaprenylcistransferase [Basidiobolus meristosporus CBS 931.73]
MVFSYLNSSLSTISNNVSKKTQNLLIEILKCGPIPRHLAFIMDGNRRFAKKLSVRTVEGHIRGYHKLEEVLEWCLRLGVNTVTVYAFSIENFKRPKEEVDGLMKLAKEKLDYLCEKCDIINEHQVRIQILGKLDLLPRDVFEAAQRAMKLTAHNTKAVLNLCFPYTSRDEIAASVREVTVKAQQGKISIDEIDQQIIEEHLYTRGCPPLDILVRTSGEVRLSDFMLWQCSKDCQIYFANVLWPQFSIWDLLPIILSYQTEHPNLKRKHLASR